MSLPDPHETSATPVNAEMAEVAAAAEAARSALGRLADAVRKLPSAKINLVRPLELIEQLADRARQAAFRSDAEADESLVRSLTGSLAALQASGSPLGPERAAAIEKDIRRALAEENGAKGGKVMTDRKRAALALLPEKRRLAAAKKRSASDQGGVVEL